MNDDLATLALSDAAALIESKQLSPVELTRGCLDRIQRFDGAISSYLRVTQDVAECQAKAAERDIMAHAYQRSTGWLKRRPELVGAMTT